MIQINTTSLLTELSPLIKHIATKFYEVPFEDLMQAGAIGVLKAYKNYRENTQVKFSSYAYDYIFGEMYELVMKNRKIKVTKDILKLAKKIEYAKNALSLKLGKIPSYEELSQFLEIPVKDIADVLYVTKETMSLDDNTKEARELYETIPGKESLSLDDKLTLAEGIESLKEDEKKIIQYRYFNDLTQSETAKKMCMSQVMISRYEQKSLKKLRQYYEVS